jgi:hypothetical protein
MLIAFSIFFTKVIKFYQNKKYHRMKIMEGKITANEISKGQCGLFMLVSEEKKIGSDWI